MDGSTESFDETPRQNNYSSRMSYEEPHELDYGNNEHKDVIEEVDYDEQQEVRHVDYQQHQYHDNVHQEVLQETELDDFKAGDEEKHHDQSYEKYEPSVHEQESIKEESVHDHESIDHSHEHHSVTEAVIEFGEEKEEESHHAYEHPTYQQEVHISPAPQVNEDDFKPHHHHSASPGNENKTPSPPPSRKIVNDFKFEESKPIAKEDQGEKEIKRGTVKGLIGLWNNPAELQKQGEPKPSNPYKSEYGAGNEKPKRQLRNNWCE